MRTIVNGKNRGNYIDGRAALAQRNTSRSVGLEYRQSAMGRHQNQRPPNAGMVPSHPSAGASQAAISELVSPSFAHLPRIISGTTMQPSGPHSASGSFLDDQRRWNQRRQRRLTRAPEEGAGVPSGHLSPWVCRAAQNRQVRSEEARGAISGTAKAGRLTVLSFGRSAATLRISRHGVAPAAPAT